MVYRRSGYRRKTGYRKKYYRRRNFGNVATKKYVQKSINKIVEPKYRSTTSSATDLSYDNPMVQDLCIVPAGTDDTERVGDVLKMKSLRLKMLLFAKANVTTKARCMIIQWLPTILNSSFDQELILPNTGGVSWSATTILSGYNKDRRRDFRVLWDKTYIIGATAGADGLRSQMIINKWFNIGLKAYKKKLYSKVHYVGGSSTTGGGKLFFVAFSDVTDASGDEPGCTIDWTLNYSDC